MARDRQRAKQRKARRAGQNPGPSRSEPHRVERPRRARARLGEADEFDAALISGAGGARADEPDAEPGRRRRDDERQTADDVVDPDGVGEVYEDELVGIDEEAERDESSPRRTRTSTPDAELERRGRRRRAGTRTPRRRTAGPRGAAAPSRSICGRFAAFLRASWAELQRVQWPDRRQVAQATAVVLGFVVVAGLYLGVADRVAQEVVDFIL